MRKIKVEDAVGETLCHDITVVQGDRRVAPFKRGHILTQADVPKLLDIGKKTIFVWEENAGKIHEDDAAMRLAAMAPVEGAHYTEPSEGKTLLISDMRGLFRVDTELLRKINSVGDITISTIADHYPVEATKCLAGLRIVPLVTDEEQIISAEKLCAGKKLFDIKPYRHLKVGIIITGSEIFNGRIQDRFEPVIRKKLADYPCDILGLTFCDDELPMLEDAIKKYVDAGADLIIMTGGMSVDPDDLTPTAIAAAGAEVITHGVPSQPGNMFMLAYLGDVALAGVPGAAVHSKITVFDIVLPQIFTGEKFTRDDFIRLGEGGLCMRCEYCHFPNCTFGRY